MACTPAMAFRLFSSLEGLDFPAGPGAGIAGCGCGCGGDDVHPINEESRLSRTNPLDEYYSVVGALFWFPCTYSNRRPHESCLLVRDERMCPKMKVPRSPGHGFGPGDFVDLGRTRERGCDPPVRVTRHCLPTPGLKPVPPSRRHYRLQQQKQVVWLC